MAENDIRILKLVGCENPDNLKRYILRTGTLSTDPSNLDKEKFDSWKSLFEKQLVLHYRDSYRNNSDDDPVFLTSNITKKTADGGFGIQAIRNDDLNEYVSRYADEEGVIEVDLHSHEFRLTEAGRARMHKLDPQIK
jgi:hypothetical protein